MNRRNFISVTGMIASGMVLHENWVRDFGKADGRLKIAVIGCGDRGQGILTIINEQPDNFLVTAICDVLDFRIEATRKLIPASAKVYKDHRQLLDDKNVDAVIISVPLNLHYSIAKDALAAHKHVYLEKTMTFSIPEALDLVSTATLPFILRQRK